ncbi:stromal processing peptidase, chloroplastic-like isoform X2 [Phragmites australis]|uniref:stromal processing peptidase, chloroplastic-like isoform X2 n=1 Tax=Phragmites australis TaxID=29695 RepID=UPI002D785F96|nr:stromal processing peptidase, chloroplastic-like isoform X2 [Phragmites australis]
MASAPCPSVAAAAAAAPPRLAPRLPFAAAARRSSLSFRPTAAAAARWSALPLGSPAIAAPASALRCTHRHAVSPRSRRHTRGLSAASASTLGVGAERDGCLSCFPRSLRRGRPGLAAPCALPHASGFSFRSRLSGAKVRPSHILHAAGPDEPHVASPTWSETSLDKPYLDHAISKEELEDVLNTPLPSHPKLIRGQLRNGLRYLILPNKVPANRFEAHMEVHVGSIDEEDDEQGIAHMIEHVAFLGSKKREKLLGTGARSNAYTDFHHTVFHIHSPTKTKEYGEDLLPSVLDALNEIAFHPKFSSSRVEKERRAILSELQMMNTIEYRVDCQLLQHLHSENKLSNRFPIGLEEQIHKWDPDKIRRFHERWYYPANATLYLVGEIDDIPRAVREIEAVFEHTLSENEGGTVSNTSPFGAMASLFAPKLPGGFAANLTGEKSPATDKIKPAKRERQAFRPPVEHKWSLPGVAQDAKPPAIFQHELIQSFSINMFCKIPVSKVQTYKDLRSVLMKRIFLSALHFRINTRYKSSNPPFTSVELDHSDSGREGCTVTTLTVTAEPQNWRSAIKVAVHEVRRLKEFGVTMGEMTRYMDALIKDSEQLAMMIDSVPSVDNLDFIMESDALGHTVMDQLQGHESLLAVAETVTLEEVNTVGAEVLEYISDFGKANAPLPAAIVACVPKKVHVDGVGETDFEIYPEEITEAIKAGLEEPIYPEPELEVPKELITQAQLDELKLQHKPSFIPLAEEENVVKIFDSETGIAQRRLSNGISINYKITQNEARVGVMRLIVGGGRATEDSESKGSVIVGVRTLSEGGCVGNFSREQVELFCVNNLINCSLESNEEFVFMEFRFALRDNGMRAAFQLLHMVLEHNVWLEDAFDRATQLYLSYYRSIPKSLERSTAHKLMLAMLNHDERFVEPSPHSLQKLTLQSVKEAVMNQFVGGNMEVSIVGDFTEEEVESCVLDYLGTVRAASSPNTEERIEKISFQSFPSDLHFQQVYIKDTDERACAYIAGPAPNRWGFAAGGNDLFNVIQSSAEISGPVNSDLTGNKHIDVRSHPLFFGITLSLLAEIINSRLFTTVRDSMGLTYDVSFELNLFDKLDLGWYVIAVTSTPSKVHKAVDACKSVLRGLHSSRIVERELDRAKRTLLMKHEAETKTNAYWLGLLAHLQSSSVPRKDVSCIKELTTLYESAKIEDLYLAYEHLKVDDSSLFACIGIAGAESGEDMNDDEPDMDLHGMTPMGGRGLSTMTRPTT